MAPYLDLDLNQIHIEPELVARVPHGLASYYLALPLALEGDQVSVAMAHPDNAAARLALSRLLGAYVVPLWTSPAAIRLAIAQSYPADRAAASGILAWCASPQRAATVASVADLFGTALAHPVTKVDSVPGEWNALLALMCQEQFGLTVVEEPVPAEVPQLLEAAVMPLVLVRGEHTSLQRVLVVVRGYASDDHALAWCSRCVQPSGATVTVLPLTKMWTRSSPKPSTRSLGWSLHELLCLDSPEKRHLAQCLRQLEQDAVPARLTLRQGAAVDQVVDELEEEAYDLLVIAAEAQGEFVAQVLSGLQQRKAHVQRPVLVVKPVGSVLPAMCVADPCLNQGVAKTL